MKNRARQRFILFVTLGYTLLALAWIVFSDQLLSAFADVQSIRWLSTAKGIFFVAATAAGLFFALRAVPSAEAEPGVRLIDAMAAGITPGRRPGWLTYAFAIVLTLSMLVLREQIAVGFGERPLYILFVLPIVLSALLGGLGPGLAATGLAALGIDYLAIPPRHSFAIATSYDLLVWLLLIATGIIVSLLSEILRNTLAKVESNRRLLDTVISGTPDAVYIKDGQGRYRMVNAAAAQFVGKTPAEIIGRDDSFLFSPESVRKIVASDRAVMAAGARRDYEEQLVTGDGRPLIFLVSKGPVLDDAGRVVGVFGIAREITDRKAAENEIRRLNAELERRVSERTAELNSANLELEDLAYALTHNLRAPLRAIDGFSRVLLEDHGARLDADARACLDQILLANANMGRLIDGILALLRCTRGELRRDTVDITALATRRLDELARAEPQRQVSREVDAGLTAVGDPAMVDMVVSQLIDNAWKFTRGRADAAIRVSAGAVDGQPGIVVADNGAGFDMAHAERLYQPFQRLHRMDEFPGIGIGLASVQRIVRRHGGEIRAVAAPNVGATFSFSLSSVTAAAKEDSHG